MCNVQVNICTNKFECNRILAGVLGICIFEKGGRCNIDASFHLCLGTRPGDVERAGHVLVGQISGRENGAVGFI